LRKRTPLIGLLAMILACAICTTAVVAPFFGPPVLSTIGMSLPGSACPDLTPHLLTADDLPGDWESLPHPRPETYLEPPLARIVLPDETSDGSLFLRKTANDEWWAVQRVYCLRNASRALAFYYAPGFAGYVDALAVPAGMNLDDLELSWSPSLHESSQDLSRCRSDPRIQSQFSPFGRSVTADTDSCGIWARYGRYVVAFEIHWTEGALAGEDIDGVVDALERKVAESH